MSLVPPLSLDRPSVAHQRWWSHRLALALAERLAGPQLWASSVCRVWLDRRVERPLAVVSDAAMPIDGHLDAAALRLAVLPGEAARAPEASGPARWTAAGVDLVWQVHADHVAVADATSTRVLALPCQLAAPVLGRALSWPLPPVACDAPRAAP